MEKPTPAPPSRKSGRNSSKARRGRALSSTRPMLLKEWESHCREIIARIPTDSRSRAGSLLACVPERAEWEKLQRSVKESWWSVESCLHLYPQRCSCFTRGLRFTNKRTTHSGRSSAGLSVLRISRRTARRTSTRALLVRHGSPSYPSLNTPDIVGSLARQSITSAFPFRFGAGFGASVIGRCGTMVGMVSPMRSGQQRWPKGAAAENGF